MLAPTSHSHTTPTTMTDNNQSRRKHILIACAAVITIFAVVGGYLAYALFGTYSSNEEVIVYIKKGENPDSVRTHLEAAGQGSHLSAFRWITDYKDYYANIRPGRYDLGSGLSALDVYRNLRSGNESPVRVTIKKRRLVGDIARDLGNVLMADSAEFASVLTDSVLLSKHGLKRETVMCIFLQNTYELYWTISGEKLLERMAKIYNGYWNDKRRAKLENIDKNFTPEQAVTLASIVEGETANKDEKPRVAGLYINRLHKGIKLQADPTVIFATGDFTIRRVLKRHLETDSPYNTYRYEGLPPGPICNPSPESLEAVLNYEKNDYIYMCAKEDFSGTHNFARTDKEHAANAAKYQKALDERGVKK